MDLNFFLNDNEWNEVPLTPLKHRRGLPSPPSSAESRDHWLIPRHGPMDMFDDDYDSDWEVPGLTVVMTPIQPPSPVVFQVNPISGVGLGLNLPTTEVLTIDVEAQPLEDVFGPTLAPTIDASQSFETMTTTGSLQFEALSISTAPKRRLDSDDDNSSMKKRKVRRRYQRHKRVQPFEDGKTVDKTEENGSDRGSSVASSSHSLNQPLPKKRMALGNISVGQSPSPSSKVLKPSSHDLGTAALSLHRPDGKENKAPKAIRQNSKFRCPCGRTFATNDAKENHERHAHQRCGLGF